TKFGIDSKGGVGAQQFHLLGAEKAYSITVTEDPVAGPQNILGVGAAGPDTSTPPGPLGGQRKPSPLQPPAARGTGNANNISGNQYYWPQVVQANNTGPDVLVLYKRGQGGNNFYFYNTYNNAGANNANDKGPDVADTATTIAAEAAGAELDY